MQIDPRGQRFAAAITTVVLAVALVTQSAWVVGFQAVVFAVLARVYAASEGFLPDSEHVRKARQIFSLEAGILVGVLLLIASLILSVIAVVRWGDSSFKHLDYPSALRLAIPAAVALMLGVQIILSSFFLSVLGIKSPPTDDE